MPLTVKLPNGKKKDEYSLYVNGNLTYLRTDPELGTLLETAGCGVAFYSASNSRRAIVFQETDEDDHGIPLEEGTLPYFKQRVRIIYKATGRKIDLLKFMCYNLEKKYGKVVYGLGTKYWLMLASFIDSSEKRRNGRDSNRRKVYQITDRYISGRRMRDENK